LCASARVDLARAGLMDGYGAWDHAVVYEDGDGDWMLVGDVPWE
jgi:auxin-responsive protein IAA